VAAQFTRPTQRPQGRPAALGVLFSGPRPYGFMAAPTRPGRRVGGASYPVLHGLFQAGKVKAISQINTMQTNIFRGQG
jgi:hypothetical protein